MPTRVRDLVIVLPGITGSVLQKDGRDIWALSGEAAWQTITSLGGSMFGLKVDQDDPDADDLGDGVRATRVVSDLTIIPGLAKIDGYTGIRQLFKGRFVVTPGSLESDAPANYFEFPYDWRRYNAAAARKLDAFIKGRLPRWREASGASAAKVILIAHSMGGLVSRHYLEVLGGWRDCRALITFGTPYRGSVNALDFLCNGYKQLFLDLTEVMRSFRSVYELLPIYEMLKVGGKFRRVSEVDGLPGINRARAEEALQFHRRIEAAVDDNRRDARYLTQGYKILPVVGTRQTTKQSARFDGRGVVCSANPPDIVPANLADGDGTVPRVSAIPIELSTEYRDTFVSEKHASLQNNDQVLMQLLESIKTMQAPGMIAIRGAEPAPALAQLPAIALDVEDVFTAEEPVTLRAMVVNSTLQSCGGLEAEVWPIAPPGPARTLPLTADDDTTATATLQDLPPGAYRVSVHARRASPHGPFPVTDVFEIAGR